MYLQYTAKLFKLLFRCNKMISLGTDESIKTQKILPHVKEKKCKQLKQSVKFIVKNY